MPAPSHREGAIRVPPRGVRPSRTGPLDRVGRLRTGRRSSNPHRVASHNGSMVEPPARHHRMDSRGIPGAEYSRTRNRPPTRRSANLEFARQVAPRKLPLGCGRSAGLRVVLRDRVPSRAHVLPSRRAPDRLEPGSTRRTPRRRPWPSPVSPAAKLPSSRDISPGWGWVPRAPAGTRAAPRDRRLREGPVPPRGGGGGRARTLQARGLPVRREPPGRG
jgi:hypothetical protein